MAKFVTAIVRGETSSHDPHVSQLEKFFQKISVQVTTNTGDLRDVVQHYATHTQSHFPVLFVQDSSIIDCSPEWFHQELTSALEHPWDICYFGGYHDRCHQQITLTDRLSITNTIRGHQAVLYRPVPLRGIASHVKTEKNAGYTEVLGKLLSKGTYRAVVRHPHLVQFDRNLARSHHDLDRNNDCLPVAPQTKNQHAIWWVIIIIAIIILMLIVVGMIWHRGLANSSYSSNPSSSASETNGLDY